jgi:hypothetical protein
LFGKKENEEGEEKEKRPEPRRQGSLGKIMGAVGGMIQGEEELINSMKSMGGKIGDMVSDPIVKRMYYYSSPLFSLHTSLSHGRNTKYENMRILSLGNVSILLFSSLIERDEELFQ